jgi:hypothetical protein
MPTYLPTLPPVTGTTHFVLFGLNEIQSCQRDTIYPQFRDLEKKACVPGALHADSRSEIRFKFRFWTLTVLLLDSKCCDSVRYTFEANVYVQHIVHTVSTIGYTV